MKTIFKYSGVAVIGLLTGAISSCSSNPFNKGEQANISSNGPTVSYARFDPTVVDMNSALKPTQPAEILADVKDFNANITDVRAQFTNVPVEVPMKNVGGTTWKGQLTAEQLRMLAVSGKTIRYDANIIAKDEHGASTQTPQSVQVAIKAPDLANSAG